MQSSQKSLWRHSVWILLSFALSVLVGFAAPDWQVFWPSLIALVLVFVLRSALWGLLIGAASGALVLSGGQILPAIESLIGQQFYPIFTSSWKLSAMLFTLLLGGFVALIELSGGLHTLVNRMLGRGVAPARRMQCSVVGMGCLVFFDGLANTLLIGRLMRSAADRCGVSREKLAYLADATGSAIACVAFVSTWIAFQLSMIRDGYAISGQELVSAYALFFKSLPTNFYCWFTLIMVGVCILKDFNPPPMRAAEDAARVRERVDSRADTPSESVHWLWAIVPIAVLAFSVPIIAYLLGAEQPWPLSLETFARAYAAAEAQVPLILVLSAVLAVLVAATACLCVGADRKPRQVGRVFLGGCRELLGPVLILIAAWMLGSVISELGAAQVLTALMSERMPLALLPAVVFLTGAIISFSTGTSWGTMGVLMPLALPAVLGLTEGMALAEQEHFVVSVIGAVFSGAVFGDHCSPFSDTTIVASIAAGIEPLDHVRTQLPFALITAAVATVCGFVPYGYGVSAWICLLLGTVALIGVGFLPFRSAKRI